MYDGKCCYGLWCFIDRGFGLKFFYCVIVGLVNFVLGKIGVNGYDDVVVIFLWDWLCWWLWCGLYGNVGVGVVGICDCCFCLIFCVVGWKWCSEW